MEAPGALRDFPRGGAAPFVPVVGGVHDGSLPGLDCDVPPVPLGGVEDPPPVPLGGAVDLPPVPVVAGVLETLPEEPELLPAVPVAAAPLCEADAFPPGDEGAAFDPSARLSPAPAAEGGPLVTGEWLGRVPGCATGAGLA
jgi:hypothetical protein